MPHAGVFKKASDVVSVSTFLTPTVYFDLIDDKYQLRRKILVILGIVKLHLNSINLKLTFPEKR